MSSDFESISNNFMGSLQKNTPNGYHYTTFGNLQLDIVGFLAVLGEGSVLPNAQLAALTRLIFLPRLIPAPQSFLQPSRPRQLRPKSGVVAGVHSGNLRYYVNHIAHVLMDAEDMSEFEVRCLEIKRVSNNPVKAKPFGLFSYLALFGCSQSFVLLALSLAFRDGMSIIAVVVLSALSIVVGIGNKWEIQLPPRYDSHGIVPDGDVVVRYQKGNFVVVK